jgi:hypothetical protein
LAEKQNGQLLSKQDFLAQGDWSRENAYEGLLVVNHGDQGYDLGVELDGNRILKVDSVSPEEVQDRVLYWAAQLEDIRREYRVQNNQGSKENQPR